MSKLPTQTHLPNRLTHALASVCRKSLLNEKWLIAPSRRVGAQWIERVVALGTPVVNVRITTLKGMAVHLAGRSIAENDLDVLSESLGPIVADLVWAGARDSLAGSYLSRLEPGSGLARTLYSTIKDLRLAGLGPGGIDTARFEVEAKGSDIKKLLAGWVSTLEDFGLADYAQVLRLARSRLKTEPDSVPPDLILLLPEDGFETVLENDLIDAFSGSNLYPLRVDDGDLADDDAAEPTLFRALGEINEVRHVFRICLEQAIPLDQAELVHTDSETYLRLIYETLACTAEETAGFEMDMPATFAEGLPARFMRPGRALAGWVSWIRKGYLQKTLSEMIHEGLLEVASPDGTVSSFSLLAGLFGRVPIGMGRDRYIEQIRRSIAALKKREGRREFGEEAETGLRADRKEKERLDSKNLALLESLLSDLLDGAPRADAAQDEILHGALTFLKNRARSVNRFDRNAREELSREIARTLALISEGGAGNLDAWEWLERLPDRVRVEGSGPRPGRIHVSNISAAAHSGRPHTFVIGLDDGRFPGRAAQDPLLLDEERLNLSRNLNTAEGRLKRKKVEFERLRARLRGQVHLGFSCRDLVGDRDRFAGAAVLAAFRALSGKEDGDHGDLDRWLDAPAAFVPARGAQAVDRGEWWLWRLCGGGRINNARQIVGASFPFLGQGFRAAAARGEEEFTGWDGLVRISGTRHDPFHEEGPVLSASALERIGTCPRAYFFQYVLGVRAPDEIEIDPARWLDPLAFGSVLHDVFHSFMSERIAAGELPPTFDRDWPRLRAIVVERINAYRAIYPVCAESVFQAQARELEKAARIFLRDEEFHCRTRRPIFLEASIGMSPHGEGTAIDCADPVRLALIDGRTIRARGRIDRIDELLGARGGAFELWDYKSGGLGKYKTAKIFGGGRLVQHALYVALAARQLRERVAPDAEIERFGYFFPGVRGRGERLTWTRDELSRWRLVVDALCRVVQGGAFVRTVEPDRCRYCDYRPACGTDPGAAEKKLACRANSPLGPILELKEYV